MMDALSRDAVLGRTTPMTGIAGALEAVASWIPGKATELQEALDELPGLFEALSQAMDGVAGRLDGCPVSEEIPAIVRRMGAAFLSAAEDARSIARMPLGDPAEGVCSERKQLPKA